VIRKLRVKFVAITMALVTLVLTVVLVSLFNALQENTASLSQQVLNRVLREDSRAGGAADTGITIGGSQVTLPYFTVNIWDDTAYVTSGTYADLEDTAALKEILALCMEQDSDSGTLPDYHLRYLRQDNGLFLKIAFVDISMELATVRRTLGSYLRVALLSLLLLFAVSCILARWAVRPVERAWDQQRQFLSDASHELKTPLTVILSNAEMLNAAELPERPARWADNIRSEARQMRSLVEQMLTLARADNAVTTAVLSEQSLSELASDCALSFEPVAFEAGKRLHYKIAEDISVSGDAKQLRELVGILLDNAIRYSPDRSEVGLSLQKKDRHAVLTVSNPGEPIPPAELRRLFERFYRRDPSRGECAGFGLGLPIARTIAEAHGGTIRAESDEFSTRFIVTLPMNKSSNTKTGETG